MSAPSTDPVFQHKRPRTTPAATTAVSAASTTTVAATAPREFGQTFTLTFGDQAENHVGMQKIGQMAERGFSEAELSTAQEWFQARSISTELVRLNELLPADSNAEPALVLMARGGLAALLDEGQTVDQFFTEQQVLDKDKKAFMYGRVVNKHARHNLCFAETAQAPDYESGKGRIVSFSSVPCLSAVRRNLTRALGAAANDLACEGNYYFNKDCGIGYHGDGERRKVVGVRVGDAMPLHYTWFHRNQPVMCGGKPARRELMFGHGDVYVMNEVAAGTNWKSSSKLTLRHAAGAAKFLKL
eukprot:m.240968 g.240968  ORF g.240968 m.240968 type:complete len:300 (-) comp54409_c0_seq2:80-979(-)